MSKRSQTLKYGVWYPSYLIFNLMQFSVQRVAEPVQSYFKEFETRMTPDCSLYFEFPTVQYAFQFLALSHLSQLQVSQPQIYERLPMQIKNIDSKDLKLLYEVYLNLREDVETAMNGKFTDLNQEEEQIMQGTELETAEYNEGEPLLPDYTHWEGVNGRVGILVTTHQNKAILAIYDYTRGQDKKDSGQQRQQDQQGSELRSSEVADSNQQQQRYFSLSENLGWCWSCLRSQQIVDGGLCWKCFLAGEHLPINKYGKPIAYGFICFILTLASMMLYR